MNTRLWTGVLAIAGCAVASAAPATMRASIVGGGGDSGKCTIEVEVDGTAEVEIVGDQGRLHTLAGQPATWRRFQCNSRMPRNPGDFRFRGIDGRGNVNLVRDPGRNGAAVVRIDDPKGGREGYTFDLEWSGGSDDGGFGRYGRNDDYRRNDDRRRNQDFGRDDGFGNNGRMSRGDAVRACREAITDRISRDGYGRVNILSADVDDNRGRNDAVIGRATAQGRGSVVNFDFVCEMNLNNGRVRNVQLQQR
jgi:hypothetical protein